MKLITRISFPVIICASILFLFGGHSPSAYGDSGAKTLKSAVSAVTVYSDRALVTRTAAEKLQAGEHRLVFDNLPAGLEPASVQVNGTGNAVLNDVKTSMERYAETPDKDRRALIDKKQMLEDELAVLDLKMKQIQGEKNFLENITKKLTGVTEKTPAGELDPERWVKMVDFYRNRNEALDKDLRDTEITRRGARANLDKVNRQISDLGRAGQKIKYQVEVLVRMKEAGELSLGLSYVVSGPGWKPVYDLRVSTREKKMNLTYNAVIRQNTSESWDDAAIFLSTAQPGIGGEQPELSPWHIGFHEPRPVLEKKALMRAAPAPAAQMMQSDQAGALGKAEEPQAPEAAIEKPAADVSTSATSVVFEIKGRNTIASDNLPHKVTVMIQDFPAEFRYSAVPKLSQHAYLKTKVKNATEFPLLTGSTNIFLDNNFVANASLSQVSPGEEFWTFLGVDNAIKVERKFVRKHQKQEGVFSKKTALSYEYVTEITNNKKTEEELVVWDQLPIASHQDITVTLVEPRYEKDSPGLKKNELNYFEWFFRIKPGEKIRIPFVFEVAYPQDKKVSGLE
ncbi:MAG: mucoidy inhibitor MuiA family protein [Nitrospirae bacterium]|nr:mucoidy inhibitor MuiA family protein [Nitrospirota bacterium]